MGLKGLSGADVPDDDRGDRGDRDDRLVDLHWFYIPNARLLSKIITACDT